MLKPHRHSSSLADRMLFRLVVIFKVESKHFMFFLKWLLISLFMGILCGLVGTAFHYALDLALSTSSSHPYTLYLLPLAGVVIVFTYRHLGITDDEGTNSILRAARAEDGAALKVTPLIFFASFITHLCAGSAGREGAALQIGGSIGSFFGRKLRFNKFDQQMMVMCGMSAVFCALFGTPLTAAFFAIEVAGVGTVFYAGLVPSVMASFVASKVAGYFGISGFSFVPAEPAGTDMVLIGKVIGLAVLVAFLSIVFCSVMHQTRLLYSRFIANPYLRAFVGGLLVIAVTLLAGTRDYNGIGIDVIERALAGEARPEAFALKMLLTALTLGAGFKGGEIVPTLFIGSTFGCTMGLLLGLDPVLAAELGMIGLFCGAVNCPVSSMLLCIEAFGSSNFILFGITGAICYLLSGYYSLYSGQKFMNSKIVPVPFERSAK